MAGPARCRDTFEEFIAQDRHYPAAASKVYSQALSKASSEGPTVFAMVREMLEDSHEELSLHAHYTEVRAPKARGEKASTPLHVVVADTQARRQRDQRLVLMVSVTKLATALRNMCH